jgi:3-hydroxybutyryl-CoA dehydrogenase
MSAADKDAVMGRLSRTTSLEDLAKADLVIEAVFEDLGVKRALFGKLNKICPAETIFASNTSTLSITEIAGASGRDDRVVGLHFCLPAQLMKPGFPVCRLPNADHVSVGRMRQASDGLDPPVRLPTAAI